MQLSRLDPDNSAYQFGTFASSKVIRRSNGGCVSRGGENSGRHQDDAGYDHAFPRQIDAPATCDQETRKPASDKTTATCGDVRMGRNSPRRSHRIVAQINGSNPKPMNTGVYE